MHPAGLHQLTHGGIDDGVAGTALAPGGKACVVIAPLQGLGVALEGAVAIDAREADQDMLVELTPDQLVDPAGQADIAIGEAAVLCQYGGVALAGRDHAQRQIGR